MRIIGGTHKGRALTAPSSRAIRPTSERTREAIFNKLAHGLDGFSFNGIRVLDLFAGTGALGLEALSRGAKFTMFVEMATEARGLIRKNADTLGLIGSIKIWRRDVRHLSKCAPLPAFDLVFADPPYGKNLTEPALEAVSAGGWLNAGGMFIAEERTGVDFPIPGDFECLDARVYGDTTIHFLRQSARGA